MAAKRRIPTKAQAKYLAALWAADSDLLFALSGRGGKGEGHNSPTQIALVKYGFVTPTGNIEEAREARIKVERYALGEAAERALLDYFLAEHHKRMGARR